jgi:hypothetical protein
MARSLGRGEDEFQTPVSNAQLSFSERYSTGIRAKHRVKIAIKDTLWSGGPTLRSVCVDKAPMTLAGTLKADMPLVVVCGGRFSRVVNGRISTLDPLQEDKCPPLSEVFIKFGIEERQQLQRHFTSENAGHNALSGVKPQN